MEKKETVINKAEEKMMNNNDNAANEVSEWLMNDVELPQYINIFMEEGYDKMDTIIQTMDEEDLKEIGINKRGHRKRIMFYVNRLKNNNNGPVAGNINESENIIGNANYDNGDVEGVNIYDTAQHENDNLGVVAVNIEDTQK